MPSEVFSHAIPYGHSDNIPLSELFLLVDPTDNLLALILAGKPN